MMSVIDRSIDTFIKWIPARGTVRTMCCRMRAFTYKQLMRETSSKGGEPIWNLSKTTSKLKTCSETTLTRELLIAVESNSLLSTKKKKQATNQNTQAPQLTLKLSANAFSTLNRIKWLANTNKKRKTYASNIPKSHLAKNKRH